MSKLVRRQNNWCSHGRAVWKAIAGQRQTLTPMQALLALRRYARRKKSKEEFLRTAIQHVSYNGGLPSGWRKMVKRAVDRLFWANGGRSSLEGWRNLAYAIQDKSASNMLLAVLQLSDNYCWGRFIDDLTPITEPPPVQAV